jgi:hypothetical protein
VIPQIFIFMSTRSQFSTGIEKIQILNHGLQGLRGWMEQGYLGMRRIFLLSPARADGERARMLMAGGGVMGGRLRRGEAIPIGEIFTFLSGLYFRGKMAYARRFANPPLGLAGSYVITTNCGLVPPETNMTMPQMQTLRKNQIDLADKHYCRTLRCSAEQIASKLTKQCDVVLLGSIATGKYVDLLLEVFGDRLLFPIDFVGRGDMSRGGLMLRCAADNTELEYVPVRGAIRHGARPPKLTPRRYGAFGTVDTSK